MTTHPQPPATVTQADALIEEIDKLAMKFRGDDTMIAEGDSLAWLCRQLIRYPDRVDERYTTNHQFLLCSAARTLAKQNADIASGIAEGLRMAIQACNDRKAIYLAKQKEADPFAADDCNRHERMGDHADAMEWAIDAIEKLAKDATLPSED